MWLLIESFSLDRAVYFLFSREISLRSVSLSLSLTPFLSLPRSLVLFRSRSPFPCVPLLRVSFFLSRARGLRMHAEYPWHPN